MSQTIKVFKMKLKLWQVKVIANNCMHFDILVKHNPVNREKYAAVLSILIKKFEKVPGFYLFYIYRYNCNSVSVNISTLPADFQADRIDSR